MNKEEIEKLQNNWNELKKWLEETSDRWNARWEQFAYQRNRNEELLKRMDTKIEVIDMVLSKMQELEQGKDE